MARYSASGTLADSDIVINAFAWSPDGRIFVTGGEDKAVRLWSMPDGKLLRTLSNNPFAVKALAWSPDGQHLLAGLAKTYRNMHIVWNTSTWKIEHTSLADQFDYLSSVGFLADSRTFFVHSQSCITVWNLDSPSRLRKLEGWFWEPIALLPDGNTLLVRYNGLSSIHLTDGRLATLPGMKYGEFQLTHDGSTLLSFYKGDRHFTEKYEKYPFGPSVGVLWDTKTMHPRRIFTTPAQQARLSPDGTRLVEADASSITICDAQSGAVIAKWPVFMWDFQISADSRMVAGWSETERAVFFWDLKTGKELHRFPIAIGNDFEDFFKLAPDCRTFLFSNQCLSNDRTFSARLFNVDSGRERANIVGYSARKGWKSADFLFTPDSRFIFSVDDSPKDNIKLWDVQTGKIARVVGTMKGAYACWFYRDGNTAIIAKDCYTHETCDFSSWRLTPWNGLIVSDDTLSPDKSRIYAHSMNENSLSDTGITVSNARTHRILATSFVVPLRDGSAGWLTRTEDNFYDGSPDVAAWIGWQTREGYKTAEEMGTRFHRPDVVSAALQEGSELAMNSPR